MKVASEQLNTVLVTDCGSTTTKAVLFENTQDGWRQTYRGEAPTTVEEPVADVTVGALNAFTEVQELSGRTIVEQSDPASHPFCLSNGNPAKGIDLYLSTSSAGGGLQMVVGGLVGEMSAESAARAALGAGAIVMDTLSADDGREDYEQVERIRHLKPDIFLLTGGVDGGASSYAIELAELLLAASPRPRFGDTLRLPVVYAGNTAAYGEVAEVLDEHMDLSQVANVRPELGREDLGPARDAIHELFLSHVMSHAPGYSKLLSWSPKPVIPTPAAVGDMVLSLAEHRDIQVLAVDIGGATTDVFSAFRNADDSSLEFNRTVSANLGMSYSIANVLLEAGVDNITRWLWRDLSESEVRDRLRNKMIRPTSIPQTREDLALEHAICREALRLSLDHHRSLAIGLGGGQQARGIANIFSQTSSRRSLVDLMQLDLVIGSGGVLSHAPDRRAAMLMLLEGFGLEGVTQIAVDSIFMMPHLGVLSSVHPAAAQEVLYRDCLINLGHSVVPVYSTRLALNDLCEVYCAEKLLGTVQCGKVKLYQELGSGFVELCVRPLHPKVDVGAGPGNELCKEIEIGRHGILLDGRNRPIVWPADRSRCAAAQRDVCDALGLVVEGD